MAENKYLYDESYYDMMNLCNDLMREVEIDELTSSILINVLWVLDDGRLLNCFLEELNYFLNQDEIEEFVRKNLSRLLTESQLEVCMRRKENKEEVASYFAIEYEGKDEIKVKISKSVLIAKEKMIDMANKGILKSPFTQQSIIIALFEVEDETFKQFFERLDVSFEKAKETFMNYSENDDFEELEIPSDISSFVKEYRKVIDIDPSEPNPILNRDEEAEQLWKILSKKIKRNVIIVGKEGVGKTALVEKITYDIITRNCPKRFFGYNVLLLDVNSLIAGTSLRGQAEEKILKLVNYIENTEKVILFIDEVHTILNAGSVRDGDMTLSTALKPCLARGKALIIGATTLDEYERYFSKDLALRRRFEKIEISTPLTCEVGDMIKNKVKSLSKYHNVTISKELVDFCIFISGCFYFEKNNPDRTLDIIDMSMSIASLKNKKSVDKKCVLESVNAYIDVYKNMTETEKKETAYHEAGHLTVGMFSELKENNDFLAISIMPAENYIGVVVYEPKMNKYNSSSYEYYMDDIACDLAGRVGEKIFTNKNSSGARVDLKYATQTAYNMVTEYGLIKSSSNELLNQNRVYCNCTEKTEEAIEKEVNRIISEGYQRAEEIIKTHMDFFNMIVKKLLEKGVLTKTEIEEVYNKYEEKTVS